MLKHRWIAGLASAAVLAATLVGCSGGSDSDSASSGPVSLTLAFWGNDGRAKSYQQSVDLFQKAHPEITVKTSFASWDNYWPQRATEAASSSLPDVIQMDLAYLEQYGSKNHLLKLDDYLGKGIDTSAMDPSVLPAGKLDGATYAIPIGTNTFTLGYNKTALDKIGAPAPTTPMTWAQYQDWIKQVAAKGASATPPVYGATDYTGALWVYIHALRSQGKKLFTDDGKLAVSEADVASWWASTAALRDGKGMIPAKRVTALIPISPLAKSEIGAEFFWDTQLPGYVTDSGSDTTDIQLLPMPTDGQEKGLFYKASMLFAAGANTKHPKEAATLIDFLINDPEVGKIFGTSKGVPASSKQRDAIAAEGTDAKVIAYEKSVASLVGDSQGALPEGFGTIEADFKRLGEEVNYGRATPEKAAKEWVASTNETLAG